MNFVPFELVAWQSDHEEHTEISLTDSGGTPASLREFVDDAVLADLLSDRQRYPAIAGPRQLRALIADLHGAHHDQVLVTLGGTEANAVALSALIRPGDHVVVVEPGYSQISGYAHNLGADVAAVPLAPARGWRLDLDALDRIVTPRTRLIAVTNPSNPTGMIMSEREIAAVVAAAARSGAWLLVDEVHRGTELYTEHVTPSSWGCYDRLLCVGSLSKAYGLPGLRIGWLVGPTEVVRQAWRRHEYLAISVSCLSARLAEVVLSPEISERLIARNRTAIRGGVRRLLAWVDANQDLVSIVPPQATSLGFIAYRNELDSRVVADACRTHGDVLVIPSAHFGIPGHFRVTHGVEPRLLDTALDRIAKVLRELR
jgi:aspartate/methionine/tyrosine aminotransferase